MRGKEAPAAARRLQLACLFMLLAGATPVVAASPESQQPTTARVLALVQESMRQPDNMSYHHDAEAVGIFGRYRWTASFIRVNGKTTVQAANLPALVSKELLADLSDFEKATQDFRLEYKGTTVEAGAVVLLVDGVRKPGVSSGALEGRLWIDSVTYRVKRMEARYIWGKLRVEYTYNTIDGVTVLAKQEASMSPLPMRMTITYRDYAIGK